LTLVAFELEWLGGIAEHHYRTARPGLDDLPWGSLSPADYPPQLVSAAQRSWTDTEINEYRAVLAFSDVVRALAVAKAPLDLVGMAADFVLDEVTHVELASRMAMELGGAAPIDADMRRLVLDAPRDLTPLQVASELVLRVSCAAEVYAGKTSVEAMRACTHPLPKAVQTRILQDESRHLRLGELYFDWVAEYLDAAERSRLGGILVDCILGHEHYLRRPARPVSSGAASDGVQLSDIHALGLLESARAVPLGKQVMREQVLAPLGRRGIVPTGAKLDALHTLLAE
jgi:hypothetical protein